MGLHLERLPDEEAEKNQEGSHARERHALLVRPALIELLAVGQPVIFLIGIDRRSRYGRHGVDGLLMRSEPGADEGGDNLASCFRYSCRSSGLARSASVSTTTPWLCCACSTNSRSASRNAGLTLVVSGARASPLRFRRTTHFNVAIR